ncbi:MAG TPA: ion transporter [Nevskiaceae bacterium]|nr:ion transporter [Nevskiaceae bacterium]
MQDLDETVARPLDEHEIPPTLRGEMVAAAGRVGIVDWLMLALAILSVGLLLWEWLATLKPETSQLIVIADYAICGVFAAEFVWRWRQAGWTWVYVKRNWYEVLGMIPLQEPALRGLRLFRVVRIVVLLSRFGRAADRALGDEFTYLFVKRFKDTIVESISSSVTVAVIDEVADVLKHARFSKNIGRAMQENHAELRAMLLEKLREDPQAKRLARLPFAADLTEAVIDAVLRVLDQLLQDPRTDELIADVLRENLHQIQRSVEANARP